MKLIAIAASVLAALGGPTNKPPPPPTVVVQTNLPATIITVAPPPAPTSIDAPTGARATSPLATRGVIHLPHVSSHPPIAITPVLDKRPQARARVATAPIRPPNEEAIRDIEAAIRADRIQLRRDQRREQATGDPLDVRKDVAQLIADLARLREVQRR